MEAIYDRDGCAVGWRRRATVFDNDGKPRAFINRQRVFTYGAHYLGRFEDRWYRDAKGRAVAFEAGATGGPLPPERQPAVAPLPDPDPPQPPVDQEPPPPRIRSSAWSTLSWAEFLEGEESLVHGA